ncbi:hypothetical protein RDWZM_004933 [Blomia tropicalis]|uniref:Uncharacterized protein n=1 Tax=Blomia tropicalis TaxID=40697 RepID=A0A9Q0M4M6_BLOTA|nr:hypothetical protein RDWZM_004933 [Blomia tropicalis]
MGQPKKKRRRSNRVVRPSSTTSTDNDRDKWDNALERNRPKMCREGFDSQKLVSHLYRDPSTVLRHSRPIEEREESMNVHTGVDRNGGREREKGRTEGTEDLAHTHKCRTESRHFLETHRPKGSESVKSVMA